MRAREAPGGGGRDTRASRIAIKDGVVVLVAIGGDDEKGWKHTLPVPPSPTRTSLNVGVATSAMTLIVVSKRGVCRGEEARKSASDGGCGSGRLIVGGCQ